MVALPTPARVAMVLTSALRKPSLAKTSRAALRMRWRRSAFSFMVDYQRLQRAGEHTTADRGSRYKALNVQGFCMSGGFAEHRFADDQAQFDPGRRIFGNGADFL